MPAVVPSSKPVKHMLYLPVDDDPEQEAYVEVRPATQHEEELRSRLTLEQRRVYRTETSELEIFGGHSYAYQMMYEAYLTLSGCNIKVSDPDNPDALVSLFKFSVNRSTRKMQPAMTEQEFALAWGTLPSSWAKSIHDAVLKVNPNWDPSFRPE